MLRVEYAGEVVARWPVAWHPVPERRPAVVAARVQLAARRAPRLHPLARAWAASLMPDAG
ncbi:MAG: hypothetical protein H6703_08470 [Myxococcales bacterium]|nr:hypothetical protein [Myxococcales bacterium]